MSAASAFDSFVTAVGNLLGELVGPSHCAACDLRVGPNTLFCPPCAATVERVGPADSRPGGCIAGFEYGGAMATAIARFKYEDRADLAPRLGRSLLVAAARLEGAVDLVIPVPLHPRRLAERGYNHAALLALPVARALHVTMAPSVLARQRHTPRQASLDRSRRVLNVVGAFKVADRELVKGARVLLVDDVRTTGATLEACAATLHEAGARQILGLVLARRG